MTTGDAQLMLGETKQASGAYTRAVSFIFPNDKETEDLLAVLQLKRSDVHMKNNEYTKAQYVAPTKENISKD